MREADAQPRREPVQTRVGSERRSIAGEALDALAEAAFAGPEGRARVAELLARFDAEVGELAADDADFESLSVSRMDWALCDVPVPGAAPGDTWAWRVLHARIPGASIVETPLRRAAACSVVGLFEVYPGEPTWVRDRLSGLVLRLLDTVGPLAIAGDDGGPAALWELRLVPDPDGGFYVARDPIDYPLELIETLDDSLARRFEVSPWPTMQDLRRARLRYFRAGERTPIGRMLRWR